MQAWAEASLKRFAYDWHRYFRGELPLKDDMTLTDEHVRRSRRPLARNPKNNCCDWA